MASIQDELRGHVMDVAFFARRLQQHAPRAMAQYMPDDLGPEIVSSLDVFWAAHDQVNQLIWQLPDNLVGTLKSDWQFEVSEAVSKLGDGLRGSRPSDEDNLAGFVRCAHFLRQTAVNDLITTVNAADGELLRASRRATATTKPPKATIPELDGPFGFDGFHWKGIEYRGLKDKQWLVLNTLWNARNRTVAFNDFAKPVWGSALETQCCSADSLGSHRRELNKFFKANKLPFHVSVSDVRETVTLKEGAKTQKKPQRA